MTRFAFIVALSLVAVADRAANPAMPNIPATVFNVTNYGAVGDGVKDNTTNIQNTINAANAAGGGVVQIPAGTFLSGPLTLLSSIHLQIDADGMLQMLPLGTYPGGRTNAQTFITCNDVHDLEISGPGKVDGQGTAWWAAFLSRSGGRLVRPMMLNLFSANRLFIHDITFQNPPYHHCGLRGRGGNIIISNLTEETRSPSPNTDGLNFVGTNSIIENCHISVGDDNIAMGSSGPINDLLITNCTFGNGHGVSIGSGITSGITNLTVINCTFTDTDNGIRIKCSGRSAPIRDLHYLNLTMTNVRMPIVIYTYYDVTGTPRRVTPAQVMASADTSRAVTENTPRWSDITFSNLTINSPEGFIGGVIWGPAEMPVSNVTFIDVTNTAPVGLDLYNVHGVKIVDSQFNFATGDTLTLCNADVAISNSVAAGQGMTIGAATGRNGLELYDTMASVHGANPLGINPLTLSGGVANVPDLVLSARSVQNFSLGTSPSTVAVRGDLTLDGTINVSAGDGFGPTNYTLFTYTGSLTGDPTLGETPAGYHYRLDTGVSGKVVVRVLK